MRLAEHVDGVDTHKLSHTLGLMSAGGVELEDLTFPTDAFGYRKVLAWTRKRTGDPSRRCWAVEGTGSFGAGLTTFLLEQGEWVVEIDRPKRPARRNGAKSDVFDAYRAAAEALAQAHLAQPRRRGVREAIRVLLCTREGAVRSRTRALCHLQALIVNAPASSVTSCGGIPSRPRSSVAPGCGSMSSAASSIDRPCAPFGRRLGASKS